MRPKAYMCSYITACELLNMNIKLAHCHMNEECPEVTPVLSVAHCLLCLLLLSYVSAFRCHMHPKGQIYTVSRTRWDGGILCLLMQPNLLESQIEDNIKMQQTSLPENQNQNKIKDHVVNP